MMNTHEHTATKICSKCNERKDFLLFGKNTNQCKACKAKVTSAYRLANPERANEARNKWTKLNQERVKENSKRYYEENKDFILMKTSLYRKAHREEYRLYSIKWRTENAEYKKECDAKWYSENREYADNRNYLWRLKNKDKIAILSKGSCIRCRDKRNEYNRMYFKKHPERANAKNAARRAAKFVRTVVYSDSKKIEAIYKDCQLKTIETGVEHHVDHYWPLRGKTVSGLHVESNLRVIPASENRYKGNKIVDDIVYS